MAELIKLPTMAGAAIVMQEMAMAWKLNEG